MLATDGDFDLMVLDLGLPGKDGLSVLRDVRSAGHRLPVIILSARDDTDVKVAGLERGADDYVTKPFRFEELLARVRVRLRGGGTPERTLLESGASSSTCARAARASTATGSSSAPASSRCSRSSCATRARC